MPLHTLESRDLVIVDGMPLHTLESRDLVIVDGMPLHTLERTDFDELLTFWGPTINL